ncbi:unnamed protein product [Closterium sp. NIES-54]
MYALNVSVEGDCYLCVPPDPGIAPAALGACESAPPGTAPAQVLHTFTLDSGASRCFFRDMVTGVVRVPALPDGLFVDFLVLDRAAPPYGPLLDPALSRRPLPLLVTPSPSPPFSAFVRDTTADKLSPRAIPCVFLGFVPDAPGWQFYDPASRHVFASQDVTFNESVPFYRLFPYRTAPRPLPPLFLAPGPPQVYPLAAPGPAPSGVSQVDPPVPAPVEVTGDSGPAGGGAVPGGAELGGAQRGGAESGGAEREGPAGTEPGGAEPAREVPGGPASGGTASGVA